MSISTEKIKEILLTRGKNRRDIVDFYKKIIDINSNDYMARFEIAEYYRDKSEFKKALEQYNKILEIRPDFELVYSGMGTCYYNIDKPKLALKYFKKAREAGRYIPDLFFEILEKKLSGKDFARDFVAESTPHTHIPERVKKADEYANAWKYDMAIKEYTNALEAGFRSANVYIKLGLCYQNTNRFEDALKIFEEASSVYPNNDLILGALMHLHVRNGNFEKALPLYEKVVELKPGSEISIGTDVGIEQFFLQRHKSKKELIAFYKRVLLINPDDFLINYKLAEYYNERGEYQKAIALYEKVLKSNPSFPPPLKELALLYKKIDEHVKAELYFEKAKQAGLFAPNEAFLTPAKK